jgi:hypothetical protein
MPLEGKLMPLRFIASYRLTQRAALATALASSLGFATYASADERVTAMLRGGERVTGRFDGFTNGLIHIDVSDTDERKIPVGDVALLDLVGGAQGLPETELGPARGDDHVLFPKNGGPVTGRLVAIEGSERDKGNPQPTTVVFRSTSGEERRLRLSEVGRLYLGRFPGAAPAGAAPTTPTAAAQNGQVTVAANQQWVSTGITVSRGQQVSFNASGEVQLSPDANDAATTAGSKTGRRLTGGPLPGQLAGALIGRVGNGQPFGIGNQPGPLPMSDAGLLYLGVNDDNHGDNNGAFTVTVTVQPGTVTSTGSRPGRIRRP